MRNWLFAFLIVVPSLAIAQISPIPIGPSAGGGGGGGAGVSSLATTCPTTGAATGAVTLSGLLNADLQTVTSYNVPASDCGWAIIANNASPVGFSLVTANYASGYLFTFKNRGAGLLTITPTAGTIDGGASATLATGQSASVYFDGTNYWSFPGKGATPGGVSGDLQINNGSGGFGSQSIALNADVTNAAGAAPTQGSLAWVGPGYASSLWYAPFNGLTGVLTTIAQTGTLLQCYPGGVYRTVTVKALGQYINTADAANNGALAIYTSASGRPGNLVDYAGSATASGITLAAGLVSGAMKNTTDALLAGNYWFCSAQNSNSAKPTTYNSNSQIIAGMMGVTAANIGNLTSNTNAIQGLSCVLGAAGCAPSFGSSGTTATMAWPNSLSTATWANVTTTGQIPMIMFQAN